MWLFRRRRMLEEDAIGSLWRTATSFSSPVVVGAWASPPNTAIGKVTSHVAIAPKPPVARRAPLGAVRKLPLQLYA